jgi:hypothetical protein
VALGVEQIQTVNLTHHEASLGREFVELDGAWHRRVNAGQIDGELLVDEDPQVVVTFELENFAAQVFELGMKLGTSRDFSRPEKIGER